jgi:Uma2 family endonuclease
MEAIAIQKNQSQGTMFSAGESKPAKRITWEEFQKKYLSREDKYKYEWVDGMVVKTKRTMDYSQIFILKNLVDFFNNLASKNNVHGMLISEVDTFFLENHRRPDIAWFTDEQIVLARQGVKPVPKFVIEVISTKDQMNLVEDKMDDYRAAGVGVVWQIFPKFEKVHVYAGDNLDSMIVCKGERLCSAAPVLPDFVMQAGDIFKA